MGTTHVCGFIATTDRFTSAYGGVQFSRSDMESLAAAIRGGHVPMTAHHDGRNRLNPKAIKAEVRPTERGNFGVWMECDVDEDEWARHGDMGGLSPTFIRWSWEPGWENSSRALSLAADASHFAEETLDSAVEALRPYFSVRSGCLYQFSDIPPPHVIIGMSLLTLQTVPLNMISSILYDVLKRYLFRPRKAEKSIFQFRVKGDGVNGGNGETHAYIETDDPTIMRLALNTVQRLILDNPQDGAFEFDAQDREWRSIRDNTGNG